MTCAELCKILASLPPDMPVYYKMYNVAGYLEETALVCDWSVDRPDKRYPIITNECLILDCNEGE